MINTLIKLIFLISLCVNLSFSWTIDDTDPVATTRFGQVRGKRETPASGYATDVRITSFIGIPYAAPPVGIRRFTDPREPEKWTGILDATNRKVMCPQVEQRFKIESDNRIIESEDCLYLNVHVLSRGSVAVNNPVMVYFHGGEFKFGGKDFYHIDNLPPSISGLVLVTVNYRLGPLGFLSTDTNEIHGNYGLRDMIMALRWVQSEISQFHGDPGSTIIAGHDAGGIAVSMLMLATHNEVLFNASFTSGGTVFTPWAFEHQAPVITRELSNAVNCGSNYGLLRCLRQKTTSELLSATRTHDLHFRPVIDRNLSLPLFRDDPAVQFRSGFFTKVPFIAGITEREGALDYYLNYREVQAINDVRDKIRFLMRPFVRRYANLDVLAATAEFQYFAEEEARSGRQSSDFRRILTPGQLDERLVQLLGDYLYNLPTEKALLLHSRFALRTKFFVFENQVSRPTFGMLQKNLPSEVTRDKFGSTHMDDIFSIFKTDYSVTPAETSQTSFNLLTCILATIRDASTCNWQDYRDTSRTFLRISAFGNPGLGANYRSDRFVAFWNQLVSSLESLTVVIPPYFPEDEFQSYQAATWSLLAIVIILLLLAVGLALAIFIARRNDKRSLKLIRQRNDEFSERGDVTERL